MRHRKLRTKLNRSPAHRKAMLRNMSASLFEHETIVTTLSKAKFTQRYSESLITKAKQGSLHARRQVLRELKSKDIVSKLFEDIAPRFEERKGGYTRITKIGRRIGDAAPMAILELTEKAEKTEKQPVKKEGFTDKLKKGLKR